MSVHPHVARRADVDAVTETITAAFQDDPVWSWAFPDRELRAAQTSVWWRFWIEGALPHGSVWLTESCEAAAVWIPPGAAECTPEDEERVRPMLVELLGGHADTVLEAMDRFEANHPHDVPHHDLSLVGTHPDHRGKGVGVGLLADNLARIDADAVPAYFESSNPVNLGSYEQLGFGAIGEFSLPAGGPTVTTMWRASR